MKCDELKQYEVFVSNPYNTGGSFREIAVLPADKVYEAIAELKQVVHDAEMEKDLAEAANTEYRLDIEKLKEENERLKDAFGGTNFYLKSDVDKLIADLEESHKKEVRQLLIEIADQKEWSQWHRQKDKDIYFECGKHWGAEYIIKMKDGSTHLAYGGCDEGGDGSVSTYLHLQEDDYEWEYDDIDIWYEIPDPRIDRNIKEAK